MVNNRVIHISDPDPHGSALWETLQIRIKDADPVLGGQNRLKCEI